MSVLSPTLNEPPLAAVVVVVDEEDDFLDDPHPAATRASATRTASSFFNGASEVLDSGTKTVSDSTSHAVVAVVLAVRDGRVAASVSRVARGPRESLLAALERAVDVAQLAHVEQLETRVLRDGTLATAYLGLARSPFAGAAPSSADDRELVAAAQARLRAKLSYTNVAFALAPETFTISELRELYVGVLGHDVAATNLQRVLLRRE